MIWRRKKKRSINLIPNGYSWLPPNLLRLHILISRLRGVGLSEEEIGQRQSAYGKMKSHESKEESTRTFHPYVHQSVYRCVDGAGCHLSGHRCSNGPS